MLKKLALPFLISVVFILLLSLSFLFYCLNKKPVVFVDSLRVFNEFKMTKELIGKGDKKLLIYKSSLDSLYVVLNTSNNDIVKNEIVQKIVNQKKLIEDFQSNYSVSNSHNIWARVNSYLKQFSEEKGYELVVGSQMGNGVFYGKKELDVTDDVLKYINSKYEGFNQ